jgi:hypothetical protein
VKERDYLAKLVSKWEDLKEISQEGLTGFIWLRIGTDGVLLLTL